MTRWFNGPLSTDAEHLDASHVRGLPRRHLYWLLGFCLLLALQISPWWYATRDGGVYLLVSRNLVRGDAEIHQGSIASIVPPGYPWLISPAFLLEDRPFLAISFVHWTLGVAFVFGVYFWTRRIDPRAAVLIAGLSSLNAGLWYHYRRTLKEIAFVAMVVWLVLLLERLRRPNETDGTAPATRSRVRHRLQRSVLVLAPSALLIAITLTRYSGILFAAGFGIALLTDVWERRTSWKRAVGLTLCVGIPASLAVLWQLGQQRQQFTRHGGPNYEVAFQHAAERGTDQVSQAAAGWMSSITRVTVPGMLKTDLQSWRDPALVIFVPVLLLVIWGWLRLVRQQRGIWELTLPIYILLYMAWPFDQGARFAVPLIPVLVLCHWKALKSLPRLVPYPMTLASVSLLLHTVVAVGYWISVDAPRARAAHQHWAVADEFVKEIDSGQVETWNVPTSIAVMTQHQLKRLVLNVESDHLAISQAVDWVILPEMDLRVEGFQERKRCGGFVLYERTAGPGDRIAGPPVAPSPAAQTVRAPNNTPRR